MSRPSAGGPRRRFEFGSKGETLEGLRPFLTRAEILPALEFTVAEWRELPKEVLARVRTTLAPPWVVRSAARVEDGADSSLAGRFLSCLDVDEADLAAAIERVARALTGDPEDRVLIQPMLREIAVSGVLTTHVLQDGAPFYVLNYDDESGKTDTITGGTGANKTVLVHRTASRLQIESERVARWVEMARELEFVCGHELPLDVEFAETRDGRLVVLQVRRLATAKTWRADVSARVSRAQRHIEAFLEERSLPRTGLLGSRTILGTMPDWNPAEIIGVAPRPLALSLYRRLITDEVWRVSRGVMGYRDPRGEVLLVEIGGRPYIDVRNSFNSLLPEDIDGDLGSRLVDAWLNRLDRMPELHDKVEFEVAFTAAEFDLEKAVESRYPGLLSRAELARFAGALSRLTKNALDLGSAGTLTGAERRIRELASRQGRRDLLAAPVERSTEALSRVRLLLEECRQDGTLPFAIAARHAFIAEALLRSAQRTGALSGPRVAELKRSIETVTGRLTADFGRVLRGGEDRAVFLAQYGHLRPGTYDILSCRYDARSDLFDESAAPARSRLRGRFVPTAAERRGLSDGLRSAGLRGVDCDGFLAYVTRAVRAREQAKLVFSRHLSDALELLARFGDLLGIDREELSHLQIGPLLETIDCVLEGEVKASVSAMVARGRESMAVTSSLHLGYLIRDGRDLFVIPLHRGAPNFITDQRVEAETIYLGVYSSGAERLAGRVVCIESADPGYDWIFTRGIAGLVTKYGGANSHMAIRCAEFGLPAAIGCGEQTFERMLAAGKIELDCGAQLLRSQRG